MASRFHHTFDKQPFDTPPDFVVKYSKLYSSSRSKNIQFCEKHMRFIKYVLPQSMLNGCADDLYFGYGISGGSLPVCGYAA